MLLPETLRRQPKGLVLLEALGLVGLIGWFDHATGWEWNWFAPYALLIVLVVWKTGRRMGLACAVLCAAAWWVAHIGSNPYRTDWGFALAAGGRLFYFVVLVVAVAAVKAHQELDRARIRALEETQELKRQILQTSEREQQRIGRDLHDSLSPHLAALRYAATFLADDLRRRKQPEAAQAEQIHEMAGEAVLPVQTDGSGLSLALEELASRTSRLSGMSVSCCGTGDIRVEDPEVGMHLYRIVQEAVNNAAKHGDAGKVTIILDKGEETFRLTVADDGKGMVVPPNGSRGMGLRSMSYRARTLGGELKIDSSPSEGTVISCEVPNHLIQPATLVS